MHESYDPWPDHAIINHKMMALWVVAYFIVFFVSYIPLADRGMWAFADTHWLIVALIMVMIGSITEALGLGGEAAVIVAPSVWVLGSILIGYFGVMRRERILEALAGFALSLLLGMFSAFLFFALVDDGVSSPKSNRDPFEEIEFGS